jgi:RHS repeat-associated protein
VQLPGRHSGDLGRFGYNGKEQDPEISGEGNSYDYGARIYNPRLGRFMSADPLAHLLTDQSPYSFALNSPIRVTDADGRFPIFINGEADEVSQGSSHYWGGIQTEFASSTSYSLPKKVSGPHNSQWSGDFLFVNGDRGVLPETRKDAGSKQAKADADEIWSKLKETMKDGKITEQIQMVSHSKGVAFGEAYIETITEEIQAKAKSEGIGFSYDENSIVEYHIGLAPYQSGSLDAGHAGTDSYYVTHDWDILSDDDATGHVLNIASTAPGTYNNAVDSHYPASFNREFKFILNVLKNGGGSKEIKEWYKKYDSNTGSSTEFTEGSENECDDSEGFSYTTN